jgi:hypothetical protein
VKCSNCSETVKPVVALDIDGTMADYHGAFIDFAQRWLNVDLSMELPDGHAYDGSDSFRDWFCFAFGTDLTTFRQIKLAYRQGGLKRMIPPYDYADVLARSCREQGAEVWVTTTRPHDRFDRVDPDSREWLRRNGVQFDGLIYSDHKMEDLAARVDPARVCFVLDDLVDTLFRADGLFGIGKTVLRRTRWNVNGPNWAVSVGSLLDARAMATAHIQDWLISHQFDGLPTTGE